jgi:hypothetical protein
MFHGGETYLGHQFSTPSAARSDLTAHRGKSNWRAGVLPKERFCCAAVFCREGGTNNGGSPMHGLIYLIGLIVVIMFILSLLGLR